MSRVHTQKARPAFLLFSEGEHFRQILLGIYYWTSHGGHGDHVLRFVSCWTGKIRYPTEEKTDVTCSIVIWFYPTFGPHKLACGRFIQVFSSNHSIFVKKYSESNHYGKINFHTNLVKEGTSEKTKTKQTSYRPSFLDHVFKKKAEQGHLVANIVQHNPLE